MNYFRITAYNKEQDYSIIMDSYGVFNELSYRVVFNQEHPCGIVLFDIIWRPVKIF